MPETLARPQPTLPPAYRRLELLGGHAPTSDGERRWLVIREHEDLLSLAARRQEADLRPLPELWSTVLGRFEAYLHGEAMIPRSLEVEAAGRLRAHLGPLLRAPRTRLARQHRMIPLHELTAMDARSRRHYARMPGTSPREKAGTRGELPGVVRVSVVDVLENRLLVSVLQQLHPRVKRLEQRYRATALEDPAIRNLGRILKAYRELETHPELSLLRPVTGAVTPTNALLKDPHYRAVWDVATWLRREEEREQNCWERQRETLALLDALAIAAALAACPGAIPLDGPCRLELPEHSGSRVLAPYWWRGSLLPLPSGEVVRVIVVPPGLFGEPGDDALFEEARVLADEWMTVVIGVSHPSDPEETICWHAMPRLRFDDPQDREAMARARHLREATRQWLEAQGIIGSDSRPSAVLATRSVAMPTLLAPPGGVPAAYLRLTDDEQDLPLGAFPLAEGVPGELILADEPWRILLEDPARDTEAAGLLASRELDGPCRPVLVLPDALGLRPMQLLRQAMAAKSDPWTLPMSVLIAVAAHPEGAPALGRCQVLSLGGPHLELIDMEHPDSEAWQRLPRIRRLLASPRDLLDTLLTALGHPPSPQARWALCIQTGWLEGSVPVLLPSTNGRWTAHVLERETLETIGRRWAQACVEACGDLLDEDAPVLIGGWPLRWPGVRSSLQALLGNRWAGDADDGSMVRAACKAAALLEAGRNPYQDRLPKLQIELHDERRRRRDWHVLLEETLLGPLDKPLERRAPETAFLTCGQRAFRINFLRGEDRSVSVWKPAGDALAHDLEFEIHVAWEGGLDGLRVRLIPTDARFPPREPDWEGSELPESNPAPEASEGFRSYPETQTLEPFGVAEISAVRTEFDQLLQALQDLPQRRVNGLEARLKKLGRTLPGGEGWCVLTQAQRGEWEALRQDIAGVLNWICDLRAPMPNFKTLQARLGLENKAARNLHPPEQRAALEALGRMLGETPEAVTRALIERLQALQRKKGKWVASARVPEGDEGIRWVETLLEAAGRMALANPGMTSALVIAGGALVNDHEVLISRQWTWGLASALLVTPETASQLDAALVEEATERLILLGNDLAEHGGDDGAWTELGQALLGLLRVREHDPESYGPGSQWAKRIRERIAAWEPHRPVVTTKEGTRSQELRFRIPGLDRGLWMALDEALRGRLEVRATRK